ncbi:MAG: hypothetical protein M3Q44_04440 [bacterium]|nr:hypothetical protein [bacterium]
MQYRELQEKLGNRLVITPHDIRLFEQDFRAKTLTDWMQKGLIHKITRGFYILDSYKKQLNELYLFSIANKIYAPSYISLESALSYYHLIPEGVFTITSLTVRKTTKIDSPFARFSYKSIKPTMMIGYSEVKFGEFSFMMAKKEKAIIDYLYLHHDLKTTGDMHEIRINETELFENFDEDAYWMYVRITENKSLAMRAKVFLDYWRNPTYAQY